MRGKKFLSMSEVEVIESCRLCTVVTTTDCALIHNYSMMNFQTRITRLDAGLYGSISTPYRLEINI